VATRRLRAGPCNQELKHIEQIVELPTTETILRVEGPSAQK
jgi:hypothetical protein